MLAGILATGAAGADMWIDRELLFLNFTEFFYNVILDWSNLDIPLDAKIRQLDFHTFIKDAFLLILAPSVHNQVPRFQDSIHAPQYVCLSVFSNAQN